MRSALRRERRFTLNRERRPAGVRYRAKSLL